jgi:hypothetical protein
MLNDAVTRKLPVGKLPAGYTKGVAGGIAALDEQGRVLDGSGLPATSSSSGGGGGNGLTTFWLECPNDEDTPRPNPLPPGFTRCGWKKPNPPSGALPGDEWWSQF